MNYAPFLNPLVIALLAVVPPQSRTAHGAAMRRASLAKPAHDRRKIFGPRRPVHAVVREYLNGGGSHLHASVIPFGYLVHELINPSLVDHPFPSFFRSFGRNPSDQLPVLIFSVAYLTIKCQCCVIF